MVALVPPREVADAFVQQYYTILGSSPENSHKFYAEKSELGWQDSNGVLTQTTTLSSINDKILSSDYKNCVAEIETVDAQATDDGGVLVVVTGSFLKKGEVKTIFFQTFALVRQAKGFFIRNDLLRVFELRGSDDAPTVQSDMCDASDISVLEDTVAKVSSSASLVASGEKVPPVVEPTSNAEVASVVPQETMADKWKRKEKEKALEKILVRLPADDLARNKTVCKVWRRLISSPSFVSAHLKRSKSDPSSHQILVHSLPFLSEPQGPLKSVLSCSSPSTALVGSVNGLVCFAGNNLFGSSVDHIWILNPVTGQAGKLPSPTSPFDKSGYDKATFAFWWDPDSKITGGYKVFKICSVSSANHIKAWESRWESSDPVKFSRPIESNTLEVWDSTSPETWSVVDMGFNHPTFHHPHEWVSSCDVSVGGFAYWIVVVADGRDSFVFSLDMKTHSVRLISLPKLSTPTDIFIQKLFRKENSLLFLANWKGEICLAEQEKGGSVPGFPCYNVWTLVADGSSDYSWFKKQSFRLDFILKRCVNSINGKLLLELDNGRMIVCDMENQPVVDVETQPSSVSVEGHVQIDTQNWQEMELYCIWFAKHKNGYPLSFNQYKTYLELQTHEEDSDFDLICVASAHDFVGSLLSIKGWFKPLQDYDHYPYFYVTWPNLATSGRRVANWNEQSEKETYESAWA